MNGEPQGADAAPFPTLVFSHGLGGTPESYRPLLEDIAAAGYFVVAPPYPLSNARSPGEPTVADVPNQPADASFVLDQVLAAEDSSWLAGLVDPDRIGAGGHS